MRVFISSQLKRCIQQDPRGLCNLAATANLSYPQLSTLMRDQIGIGPVVRAKIVTLGHLLGLSESECFRDVVNTITSPWLTLDQAAAYAKVSIATITRALKSGGLRGYKVQGKKLWRFNIAELDRWLESGGAA